MSRAGTTVSLFFLGVISYMAGDWLWFALTGSPVHPGEWVAAAWGAAVVAYIYDVRIWPT